VKEIVRDAFAKADEDLPRKFVGALLVEENIRRGKEVERGGTIGVAQNVSEDTRAKGSLIYYSWMTRGAFVRAGRIQFLKSAAP